MSVNDKITTIRSTAKRTVKKAAVEGTENLEKIAVNVKNQALEVVAESKEAVDTEVKQFNETVQQEITSFRQEVLRRIEVIKAQFSGSQKDLKELKAFIKTEANVVLEELSKLGNELKGDVSQISLKHKLHITETLKRSKEHTLEAWHKVSAK